MYKEDLRTLWEEGHSECGGFLLGCLKCRPFAVHVHDLHAPDGFFVVDERCVEGFGKGCIGYVLDPVSD